MLILKYIMMLLIATVVVVADAIPQPYSKAMVANSQKYVVYAYLANRIYGEGDSTVGLVGDIDGGKWKLVRFDHGLNGFQAGIYKNTVTKKYIAAIGGTMANPKEVGAGKIVGDMLDVATDLRLISNLIPDSQSKSALAFIDNRVVMENNKNVVITIDAIVGHSLGGGLAAYAGLYSGIKAITFNPSPIPFTRDSVKPMLDNHALGIASKNSDGKVTRYSFTHEDKITNIMSSDDPVSAISFLLEKTDLKYYSALPVWEIASKKGKWNFLKQNVLFIPGRLHLDYANIGKNIWLPIKTYHWMEPMLEKMKDAKWIDDHNKYLDKWKNLNKKFYKLHNRGLEMVSMQMDGKPIDDYYPTKKASMRLAIRDLCSIYPNISNLRCISELGLTGQIDRPTSTEEEYDVDHADKYDDYISYKEYMLIAEAMYRKLFGGQVFFSYLRKKNKSYLVYDKKLAKYASTEMNMIYGHIFSLHYWRGTPKKYLQNDSQDISNAFVINFLDRFLDVLVMYKSKIK